MKLSQSQLLFEKLMKDAMETPTQSRQEKVCKELGLKTQSASILSNFVPRMLMKKEWMSAEPDMKKSILIENLDPSKTSSTQLWSVFSIIGKVKLIHYPADFKAFGS